MINIKDFLPVYPMYQDGSDSIRKITDMINVYGKNGKVPNSILTNKKEFQPLERIEPAPEGKGRLLRHQENIRNFISGYTPYDSLLVFGEPGIGKTCTAVGIVEQTLKVLPSWGKALVLLPGQKPHIKLFMDELAFQCTPGQYIPDNYNELTENQKTRRTRALIDKNYIFDSYTVFAEKIMNMSDARIQEEYSNRVVIMDEVHGIKEGKHNVKVKTYEQIYRFTHVVKNCKFIMLSGTPAKDRPSELARIMNLILPKNQTLPISNTEFDKEFIQEHTDSDGVRTYTLTKSGTEKLRKVFNGRVSYIRTMQADIPKIFAGKIYPPMRYHKLVMCEMSPFQSAHYKTAFEYDKKHGKGKDDDEDDDDGVGTDEKDGRQIAYKESKQAIMFVYPEDEMYKTYDGTGTLPKGLYGSKGFNKYMSSGKLNSKMINLLKGKSIQETIDNIKKCGIKMGEEIEKLMTLKDRKSFVYMRNVKGSGALLFGELLRLVGLEEIEGKHAKGTLTDKDRYIVLTGDTSHQDIERLRIAYNNPNNMNGEKIRIIVGSGVVSEAVTFKNTVRCAILSPHWNNGVTEQAIGRIIRAFAHSKELKAKEIVISRYCAVGWNGKDRSDVEKKRHITRSILENSVDFIMYFMSEDKDLRISLFTRLMKEGSFDCYLNRARNSLDIDQDYSRECNYMKCEYKCYDSPEIKERYTDSYDKYYSGSEVLTTVNKIKDLFSVNFSLNYFQIKEHLRDVSDYIIIRAIKLMSSQNVPILNKYGFISYLREKDNDVFLVEYLSDQSDKNLTYYVENPGLRNTRDFKVVLSELSYENVENVLTNMKGYIKTKEDEAKRMFDLLNSDVKSMVFEKSMIGVDAREEKKRRDIKDIKDIKSLPPSQALQTFVVKNSGVDVKEVKGQLYYINWRGEVRCMDDKKWDICPADMKIEEGKGGKGGNAGKGISKKSGEPVQERKIKGLKGGQSKCLNLSEEDEEKIGREAFENKVYYYATRTKEGAICVRIVRTEELLLGKLKKNGGRNAGTRKRLRQNFLKNNIKFMQIDLNVDVPESEVYPASRFAAMSDEEKMAAINDVANVVTSAKDHIKEYGIEFEDLIGEIITAGDDARLSRIYNILTMEQTVQKGMKMIYENLKKKGYGFDEE